MAATTEVTSSEEKTEETCIVCYGRKAGDGSTLSLWTAIERKLNNGEAINVHEDTRACLKLLYPCLLTAAKRAQRKQMVIDSLNLNIALLQDCISKDDTWEPRESLKMYVLMNTRLRTEVEKYASRIDELIEENTALKDQLKEQSDHIHNCNRVVEKGKHVDCNHVDKKKVLQLLMKYGDEKATHRLLHASLIDGPNVRIITSQSGGVEGAYYAQVQKLNALRSELANVDITMDVFKKLERMVRVLRDECESLMELAPKKKPRLDLL